MATYGRRNEIEAFLQSLCSQSFKDFELIVVDQNEGDYVKEICGRYDRMLDLKYIRSDRVGLSYSRNLGLKVANGDVIGFPDDDCEYPEDLLKDVCSLLGSRADLDGIAGVTRDKASGKLTVTRFATDTRMLSPTNLWTRCSSISIFLRKGICDQTGGFDELFGIGSRFGAGEEVELLLRALHNGNRIQYCPELVVNHPDPFLVYDTKSQLRAYNYGMGLGAVLGKHIFGYRCLRLIPYAIDQIIRPLSGTIIYWYIANGRARYYFCSLKGRIAGLIQYGSAATKT